MTDTQNPIDMENVNRIVDRIDLAIDGVPMNFAEFAIAAAIVSNSLAVMALQDSQKEESNGSIN